ncbi:porin [Vibrio aestuarianus]|nr:porin [Vibrio aestuarianus]
MKKKLIAIAVASTLAPTLVSAATVYQNDDTILNIGGRAEVRGNISDANKTTDNNSSYEDMSRVRLSVDGQQKLSDDVSFVGKYEFELVESDDADSDDVAFNTRFLYAGIETSHGNLYYGHQNNAVTYLTDWTDMAETFSGYVNEYTVSTADRAKNVLRYEFTTDYGLTVQVDGNFNSDSGSAQSDGYGVVLAYSIPVGLDIGIGYSASDETYGNGNDTDTSDAFIAAAKYTNDNGIWLAAMYQGGSLSKEAIKNSDYNAADAYLGYSFGDNTVNLTYSYFSADKIDDLDINFIAIEYARYMGNVAFYGSYKFNLLDEGEGGVGDNDEDELMLGMRYSF